MTVRQALLGALLMASCVDEVDLRLPPTSPAPVDAGFEDPDAGLEPMIDCEIQGFLCADRECPPDTAPIDNLACPSDPNGAPRICCTPTPTCLELNFICLDPSTSTTCPENWRVEMFACPNAPFTLCCGR